jgi:hypothetical protein
MTQETSSAFKIFSISWGSVAQSTRTPPYLAARSGIATDHLFHRRSGMGRMGRHPTSRHPLVNSPGGWFKEHLDYFSIYWEYPSWVVILSRHLWKYSWKYVEIYPINADHGAGICTSGKLTVCELEAMVHRNSWFTQLLAMVDLSIVVHRCSIDWPIFHGFFHVKLPEGNTGSSRHLLFGLHGLNPLKGPCGAGNQIRQGVLSSPCPHVLKTSGLGLVETMVDVGNFQLWPRCFGCFGKIRLA